MSQKFRYPEKLKEADKMAEPPRGVQKTIKSRFDDRASKSGRKNAKAIWGDDTLQCENGWLSYPARFETAECPL